VILGRYRSLTFVLAPPVNRFTSSSFSLLNLFLLSLSSAALVSLACASASSFSCLEAVARLAFSSAASFLAQILAAAWSSVDEEEEEGEEEEAR
jgi:hypothetical protein